MKGEESAPLDEGLLLDFSDLNLSTSSEHEAERGAEEETAMNV